MNKKITEISNPLIEHYIGIIRNKETNKNEFANAIENITCLMSSCVTKDIELSDKKVYTPLVEATINYFCDNILIIPILRAGMSMFDMIKRIIPYANFGYLGMKRDVKNNYVDMYYHNLPENIQEYKIYILDVVIATGSTINFALKYLTDANTSQANITIVNILSSRQGIINIQEKFPDINILTCKIDEILTAEGMVIPGLGDAGDRLNGYEVSE